MIHDLRFIERDEKVLTGQVTTGSSAFEGLYEIVTKRILQAYDGHVWFDIPMVSAPLDKDR